jgi:hypothetical protein
MASNDNAPADPATRARRGSFTTQTFNNIFGRSNSTSGAPTAPFPGTGPITTAAAQDQRRRMSISTLGLSGSSPTQTTPFTFGPRRGSMSTDRSDSIDESAIDDDDGPSRSVPTTPFARRMSFGAQALRARTGGSPGANGRASSYTTTPKPNSTLPTIPAGSRGGRVTPPKAQASQASTQSKPRTASDYPVSARPGEGSGFNWSEQLRSRAESSVSQTQRPSFSTSPVGSKTHERTKSVTEMATPPMAVPAPAAPVRRESKKPDAFQERILKGDFYMD